MDTCTRQFTWIFCLYSFMLANIFQFQGVSGTCVLSCSGIRDGSYQSCDRCTEYVSCGGGILYKLPCGPSLYWDDNRKNCVTSSNTCISSGQSDMVAFWPFNCKYYTRDISSSGLSATYDPNLATMPSMSCGNTGTALSGSLSFALTPGLITPKFLQINSPLPLSSQQATGYTWITHIMVPSSVFTDSEAPIFSFGRNPTWRRAFGQVGLGVYWNGGNIQVFAASNNRINLYSLTAGMMSQTIKDTWLKILVSYDISSSKINLRIGRVADLSQYGDSPTLSAPSNFTPYTGGAIRFGFLDPNNNGGNQNGFRGSISCVQLYKTAFSKTRINSVWRNIPPECSESGITTPATTAKTTVTTMSPAEMCRTQNLCTNNALSGQPGRTNGQCVPTQTSYYCLCPDGYRWDSTLNVCVDVDETFVQKCGCEGTCINKYVNTDGVKYQCSCDNVVDRQLGPDGHRCIAINSNVPTLKVWPLYGPKSGGTVIYIQDTRLDGTVTVSVGGTTLPVIKRPQNRYECTTTPLTDITKLNAAQALLIKHNGQTHAELSFTYMEDPVIASVQPLRAIAAGGTLLTVSGQHMDSVANPMLTVKRDSQTYKSFCEPTSTTTMECPTPTIDYLTVHNSRRRKRQTERELKQVNIGFDMDGVEKYKDMDKTLPEFSKVMVVMNPEFEIFPGDGILDYNGKDRLDIKGSYMDMGATTNDYSVKVEQVSCSLMDLTSNVLSCQPPNTPPPIMRKAGMNMDVHRVMIGVGYYDYSVGYLRYSSGSSLIPIIAGCVGGAVVLIIVVICIICCVRKNNSSNDNKKDMFEKHHDFTYRQGKGPPSKKHIDDTMNRSVHAPRDNPQDVYTNDGKFSNDFAMKKNMQMYESLSNDKNMDKNKNNYSNLQNAMYENPYYVSNEQDYEVVHENDKKYKKPAATNGYMDMGGSSNSDKYAKKIAPKNDYMNMQGSSKPAGLVSSDGKKKTVLDTSVPLHAGTVPSSPSDSYDYVDARNDTNPMSRAQQVFGDFKKPPPRR